MFQVVEVLIKAGTDVEFSHSADGRTALFKPAPHQLGTGPVLQIPAPPVTYSHSLQALGSSAWLRSLLRLASSSGRGRGRA